MMSEHQKINDEIARLIGAQAIELIALRVRVETILQCPPAKAEEIKPE